MTAQQAFWIGQSEQKTSLSCRLNVFSTGAISDLQPASGRADSEPSKLQVTPSKIDQLSPDGRRTQDLVATAFKRMSISPLDGRNIHTIGILRSVKNSL
ncbi:hypothetical protein K443DRAFT_143732 [Laccaria amethystina LaAM-08-1]|uniref:Uncharacterized protein n=1 Tax=Laccaria amethystina LaAM-08-1 TaxID=1095629 RepID=A0A0C9YQA6_9AGAR|nr:hypothetical protein K443DRAFT_143732 [Laccaria amethystina LaAM-08-1]